MLKMLEPKQYCESIYAIDLQQLRRLGIKAIIFDLDNTLVHWNSNEYSKELIDWLAQVDAMGFRVCVVSNNHTARVSIVTDALGIPSFAKAGKPRGRGFQQAMAAFGLKPEEVAVVGDQVFTDVLGGNRLNLYTILVNPLSKREFFGTKLMRYLEKVVFRFTRDRRKN